jgi:hypothetical protein
MVSRMVYYVAFFFREKSSEIFQLEFYVALSKII